MNELKPLTALPTHDVLNMPELIGDQDLWQNDLALREWVQSQGGGWGAEKLAKLGKVAGADQTFEKANQANKHTPELRAFDRHGRRLNQVEYHPAYHDLMAIAIEHEVPSFPWTNPQVGSQVIYGALNYMMNQPEGGVMCPMAMTYSAIPSLRMTPGIADEWIPRLLSTQYDPRDIPVEQKTGATIGMFMTEKQGGSDVRANTTRAVPVGSNTGPAAEYTLSGHKYFCSAPMSDAFLTLAYTDTGLTCFLVPRWRPDGERNNLSIQRLKDKLGNRSNASSEMEFHDTYGVMVGQEGRGIATIIEMVAGNRYYCALSSSALMRQALVQALHHVRQREAFGSKLIDKPLMRNVIADMAIEVEASIALSLRIGRALDESDSNEVSAALARIGTAAAKYWVCKRAPAMIGEALECLGGPGYIEESLLPRLYREAPINGIWEGSGNIMCLDVLRAMQRDELAQVAVISQLESVRGEHRALDSLVVRLKDILADSSNHEMQARQITRDMAVGLQASLLIANSPSCVSDAYCQSRLGENNNGIFGNLAPNADLTSLIERALPA
jgi:putative acyl-CoA dehydrogenase